VPRDISLVRKSFTTGPHTTSYLQAGPPGGPLLIFVHGWPALGVTWRHQMVHFAARGFRVVAPDLRGYGHSTVYTDPTAYSQELIVSDMLALHDHLGGDKAIWVGHDWGSLTVWNIASHHPQRCVAAATLAVPFGALERGLDALLQAVDRERYSEEIHPHGQFDYMVFYERYPERSTAVFDAAPASSVKALFRRGDPAVHTRSAPTAMTTMNGGWFGGADSTPDVPLDRAVLTPSDHAELTASLVRNGFHGPTGYYLNHRANAAYADQALHGGTLDVPVLFVGAAYDPVADLTSRSILLPMRQSCADLTEAIVPAGHWLHLEAAAQVNEYLADWLANRVLIGDQARQVPARPT
jgi:soluble epoxide hydrolase / lipid-phosphate phosphatase